MKRLGMQHITSGIRVVGSFGLLLMIAFLTACTANTNELTNKQQVYSPSDFAKNMVECLSAEGWDVFARPDNGISSTIPSGQDSAYKADHDACVEKFGYDIPPPPATEEELRDNYQKIMELRECLENQGYDLGDPPSEQYYLDNHDTDSSIDPYYTINTPGSDEQEYFALLKICPRDY